VCIRYAIIAILVVVSVNSTRIRFKTTVFLKDLLTQLKSVPVLSMKDVKASIFR